MSQESKIELFVKASVDAESVGNCPFCQRLFMILLLKGVKFKLTTVDMRRAPDLLKNVAPGSQPPFLVYNGELITDTNEIEEFLEKVLAPPEYPRLSCRNKLSNNAGEDIFRSFSAYIKNRDPSLQIMMEKKFLSTLVKLNIFLETPNAQELELDPTLTVSSRKYLDGDELTLADCNLLPKLHIVKVVSKALRDFDIPTDLKALTQYLNNAYQQEDFRYTCPRDTELLSAYYAVAKFK